VTDDAPDFAMLRAVEILANIYERRFKPVQTPSPPCDKPILLFSETIAFAVGETRRADVERALGVAFAYPARGWHTYCVRAEHGRAFVSLFYGDALLVAAEAYLSKTDRAPKLEPRDLRFRLVPGEIALGNSPAALPEHFGRVGGLTERAATYAEIFEARFPGGAAYAMGNGGAIERLAIYAHRESAPQA
jgi:hypothetical protein